MTTKQSIGNMMWMATFLAALTSPFWGHWTFGLGVLLMAIAAELRKEVLTVQPTKAAQRVRWREPEEASKD
ncbi:MAG TPA: hypothetical protein V6D05_08690 [Stenomitos sp.]